jgi:hypothetical protein
MKRHLAPTAAGLAAAALLGSGLVAGSTASAQTPSNAVPFASSVFSGYGTGTELYTSLLPTSSTTALTLEQAPSAATTASPDSPGVLTSPINVTYGTPPTTSTQVVQPAEPSSVNSYSTGDGLELGIATPTTGEADANQVVLGAKATQVAPPVANPYAPVKTSLLNLGTGSTAALSTLATAQVLQGEAASIYNDTQCPIGQPISYGYGDAAGVNALNIPALAGGVGATTGSVLSTSGTGTSAAQTASSTYLSPNGDGTWGLSTSASEDIAPVSLNLLGVASLNVGVQTAGGVDDPVTLTAQTSGESAGSVKLSSDDIISASLTLAGQSVQIASIPVSALGTDTTYNLSISGIPQDVTQLITTVQNLISALPAGSSLLAALQPILTALQAVPTALQGIKLPVDLSLGTITIDTTPTAIPGDSTANNGMTEDGMVNLVSASLGLSGSIDLSSLLSTLPDLTLPTVTIGNVALGQMETKAATAAPIICNIPVIKTAVPTSITAGQPFTYTIDVPNPADIPLIDCNLDNLSVSDAISDVPGKGSPTFHVTSAIVEQANSSGTLVPINNTATISEVSPDGTTATVTWTGLTWVSASPPLVFVINLTTPTSSPSGIIQDTATATATLGQCTGGAAGSTSLSTGTQLTGAYTLQQPTVTGLTEVTPTTLAPTATATTVPKNLPFTGAIGGPWQPVAGVIVLGLGGAGLALTRRSRRRVRP